VVTRDCRHDFLHRITRSIDALDVNPSKTRRRKVDAFQ
jgi:hypothetical protein